MIKDLINKARQQWTVIKNERNKNANTAERVGKAGLALVDAIENTLPSATLTVITDTSERYDFGLHELTQQPQPYYAMLGDIIGEI